MNSSGIGSLRAQVLFMSSIIWADIVMDVANYEARTGLIRKNWECICSL